MGKKWKKLMKNMDRQMALKTALTMLEYDMETEAPEEAHEYTSQMVGILNSMLQEEILRKDNGRLLDQLEKKELPEERRKMVHEMQKERRRMAAIPAKEYREFSALQAKASTIWARARENNDFSSFEPVLDRMLEMTKKMAGYRAEKGQKPYDVLLNDYEESFTMESLDPFFAMLKKEIVPLWKKLEPAVKSVDDSFLYAKCDIQGQKRFCDYLLDVLGFDRRRGVAGESAHPFTTSLHNHDVRITNHYYEDLPVSGIFSVIHETGHALYEMGIRDELTQTPLGGGTSCGMHECQSRFYENMIGRSEAFWIPIYGKLQEMCPEPFAEVERKEFIRAINKPKPELIRVESDEISYFLHILVRYELEKALFAGDLKVKDLPEAWNDRMEEYLGIRPKNDREGVLQDIHWAQGSFGYFPSYALGNAFAAQIYYTLRARYDVDGLLREGQLGVITEFLRENIHQYGGLKSSREILKDITGEDFDPSYYVRYLKEKFTGLYL
ncbi:MAG: carboxypeptidase M32 [Clostridiales bacterium]|nr:carboxypeptidase M32 [Clostridiales bacterium]